MFQITSLGLFLPFSLLPSRSSTTKWGIRSLCEQSCRFFPGQVYLVSLGSLCSLLQTTASLMIGSFSQSFWPTLRCHFCVFACLLSLFFWLVSWIWSSYSDLTRPHTKWRFSKGIPLISGKPRLVNYYNLARWMFDACCECGTLARPWPGRLAGELYRRCGSDVQGERQQLGDF